MTSNFSLNLNSFFWKLLNYPEPDGHGLNLYSDLGAQHLDLGFQEGGEINLQLNYGPPHKASGASRIVITKA